jgi:hypothetical protein
MIISGTRLVGGRYAGSGAAVAAPAAAPLTVIGEPYGGGYFAGNYVLGATTFALIIAPINGTSQIGTSTGQYAKRSNGLGGGTKGDIYTSDSDGLNASKYFGNPSFFGGSTNWSLSVNKNSTYWELTHPTSIFRINGFSGWYIPSLNELNLIVNNLHPSTTTAPLFQTGGAQALNAPNNGGDNSITTGMWSSSTRKIGTVWYQWAWEAAGGIYSPVQTGNFYTSFFRHRAIRRIDRATL